MAVYTLVKEIELKNFLQQYDLGSLVSFKGIVEGIENTNFRINTEKGSYILTLFEKRVNEKDLPFFMNLQKHLSSSGFQCPIPIANKDHIIINNLCGKKAIIISLLEGKQILNSKPEHCFQIGEMISKFKNITANFKESRKNTLDIVNCKLIFSKCLTIKSHEFINIIDQMQKEIETIEKNWPKNLPKGIIHGDLFKDNIFFQKDKFSGLIDFYFSCNDYYAYELAITTNAWCFNNSQFNKENFISLMKGYKTNSNFNEEEENSYNILLRAAAMRILVTRLHDQLFHPNDAIVVPKDPLEYFAILKWHQNNSVFN